MLTFAAALIWGAVTYGAWMKWPAGGVPSPGTQWWRFTPLMVFAMIFIAPRIGNWATSQVRVVLLLLGAAVALIAYVPLQDPTVGVLLAIVAAQFAYAFEPRTSLSLLVIINVVLAWLFAQHSTRSEVLENVVLIGGLQLFTFMTATYALDASRARDALMRANAELLATRELLRESGRLDERLRLTRELHDLAGYSLMALKLQLRQLARHPHAVDEDAIRQCVQLTDKLLAEVRGIVSASRGVQGVDLNKSLTTLINNLPRPGIELHFGENMEAASLAQANALLRAVQEGLTNAIRHADAEHIVVSLARNETGIALSIEDDGQCRSVPRYGNGLAGMRERLRAVDGTLEVTCPKRHGLRLNIWIPIEETAGS